MPQQAHSLAQNASSGKDCCCGATASSSQQQAPSFHRGQVCDGVGGRQLRSLALSPDMFTGDVMLGEVKVDLMAMTVSQLSAELAARDEPQWAKIYPSCQVVRSDYLTRSGRA